LADIGQAEIYDPSTGTFAVAGSSAYWRRDHTSTLLPDGKVLLVGGYDAIGNPLAVTENYDPGTGTFTVVGYLNKARAGHTAALLSNGRVLVAGGDGGSFLGTLNDGEIFDENLYFSSGSYQGLWTAVAGTTMQNARRRHTLVRLLDGTVLAIGGSTDGTDPGLMPTVDRFTPSPTDISTGAWTAETNLQEALGDATATLLPDGNVLLGGGTTATGVTNHLEIFDAVAKTFSLPATPTLSSPRRNVLSILGADGNVHLLGGWDGTFFTSVHEVFNPATVTLGFGVSALLAPRENGVNGRSVLLLDGSILTVGYDSISTGPPRHDSEIIQFQ
jgi:hypothetical protein